MPDFQVGGVYIFFKTVFKTVEFETLNFHALGIVSQIENFQVRALKYMYHWMISI